MAAISVTYSFNNGTTLDAGQINTNFSDIIAGTSDGTKDFNIAALTVAGIATLNGNVLLGNASGDDVQFNGSLATSIPIKTANTYNIGAAGTGLASVYISLGASNTVRLLGSSSGTPANWTFTFPSTAGVAGQVLVNGGSGTMAWKPGQVETSAKSADYTVTDSDGIQVVLMTTASTSRTVTLPTLADNLDREITVTKVDSGTGIVTVAGEGSETIGGAASVTLRGQYQSITLKAGASEWNIISHCAVGLPDALATAEGKKIYSHGTTYNNGIAPTVTLGGGGGSLSSVTYSEFIPYQMQNGSWRMKGNFRAVLTSASRTSAILNVNGVSFDSFYTVTGSPGASILGEVIASSTGNFTITHASATTDRYNVTFDVPLSSKPTWAY